MRILVKIASRSRPDRLLEAMHRFRTWADGEVHFLISLDKDDAVMLDRAHELKERDTTIKWGKRTTKIGAINRDVSAMKWDLVIAAADDMVPVSAYDRIITENLAGRENEPLAIWCPDGRQDRICTVPVMTRAYFDIDGDIFNGEYLSYFCDDEWTEKAIDRGRMIKIHQPMFRHDHPFFVRAGNDALYDFNRQFKRRDRETYIRRKLAGFP